MDLIDSITDQELQQEPPVPESTEPHDAATVKTEETIEKLETEIDKAYESIEHKFQELWANTSKNVEKIKLEEHKQTLINQLNQTRSTLNEKTNELNVRENLQKLEENLKNLKVQDFTKSANTALDLLDSKLEIVENEASKYFGSFTSFLSNIVSVKPETETEPKDQDREVVFNSSLNQYNNYGTTRYDNDLLKLHTTADFYLSEDLDVADEVKSFNADDKTKVISELLDKYSTTLTKVMNELVPVKISYNLFWYRYFKNEDKLKEQEKKRKELLEKKEDRKKTGAGDDDDEDEEDFTWDDEDEEEEEQASETKKDASTKDSKKDKDGDDEEDDWE
ncbi:DOS2 Protein DOS2 [Candida maltosa Xu316]|uniref:BSD domain-containing protein n=1 Tax=Candida maltosa (strain Xu316) TaxID=1245528 RepID=M3K5A2_CANMX|nr:hypothetical protein G210_5052 [Candida maltosa Xu316]